MNGLESMISTVLEGSSDGVKTNRSVKSRRASPAGGLRLAALPWLDMVGPLVVPSAPASDRVTPVNEVPARLGVALDDSASQVKARAAAATTSPCATARRGWLMFQRCPKGSSG